MPGNSDTAAIGRSNLILMIAAFGGLAGGVVFPGLAEPLAWVPKGGMLLFLFLCFIAIDPRETWNGLRSAPGVILYLAVVKLLLLPVLLWGALLLPLPEYALVGVLLGGAPVGVIVPVLAIILGVDFTLALVGVAVTTLLLPLTLPPLAQLASVYGADIGGVALDLPFGEMTLSLAVTIFIPLVAAQLLRRQAPALVARIGTWRSRISTVAVCLTGLAVFSRYSDLLLRDLSLLLTSVGVAVGLAFAIFGLGFFLTRRFPPAKRVAFIMSCTGMNNVLMLILSAEFFGVREALVCAFYQLPFFGFLVLYRALFRSLAGREEA